ncbi:MAG: OmpA family protein [Flavobacteriales bacterium]|nr:OmpA family protein [Flavobacteriales bacterium]
MKHIFTLVLSIVISSVFAQNLEFKTSNFKDKKDKFKAIKTKLDQADEYLNTANDAVALVTDPADNFTKALNLYLEAQKFNANSARNNMNIANCYLYSNEKYKAIEYADKAYKLNAEVDPFIHFIYGQTLQLQGQFKEAKGHYKTFEENAKNKYVEEYKKLMSKYKKECKYGEEIMADKKRVWVDLVAEVNSPEDDFSPALSVDGETLIINSRRKNSHTPNENGVYDSEIYQSSWDGKKWSAPKNVGAPLNTPNDEAASALAYDGQRLLIWKTDDDGTSTVYESKLNGISWGEPHQKMSYIVKKDQNTTFACYEPLDIKIHYITDKRGNRNIDFSGLMVQYDNKWGEGKSVSHKINSKFHEESVYLHPSGEIMYFSSQGHNSMGGTDIFVSYKDEMKQWGVPINLGYPINTPYDDQFFAATANGKYAYISSNRPGGAGGTDIYKVTFWGLEKQVIVDTEDYLLASIAKPIKDKTIAQEVKVEQKSLTVFKGKVVDAITSKPVEAELDIVDNANGKHISTFKSNSATGKFLLSLPAGTNYGISVKKTNYLFHSENFNLPSDGAFNMVDKTIELKNIKIGSKIALRNVFFATGSSTVTKESHPELDRLVKLLTDVPGLKIEISGHTDNQGSEKLNTKLSQERAEAVMAYVKSKGIAADRMTAKGYGPSQPVADNNTSSGRQENRRTELKIIAN